ncbi:acyltransferase [Collinsella sp. AGMB00827]|uniref:Acyltransferase n=2 Tax=Collinsella ureilytica TaxID=2869515 RepID=A0ABS7MIH7_9ACTN|nr:acyltransferase [Collinsella urealyticum]
MHRDSTVPAAQTSSRKGRVLRYDFARVVAMTFVIAVHSLTIVVPSGTVAPIYLIAGQSLFFTCNAIFFTISGRFNLKAHNVENPTGYYVRKTRGIIIPVIILFFLRTVYQLLPNLPDLGTLMSTFIRNSLGPFGSTDYWFLFWLIPYLAVVPFLGRAFSTLKKAHSSCISA